MLMVMSMMVSGLKIENKDKEYIIILTETFMKDSFKIIKKRDMVFKSLKVVVSMKVNFKIMFIMV